MFRREISVLFDGGEGLKKAKTGAVFYCLQYGRKGKHVSKHIPAAELEAYREAAENDRLFMEAVDKKQELIPEASKICYTLNK